MQHRHCGSRCRHRRIDPQALIGPRFAHSGSKLLFKIGCEGLDLLLPQRHARRHGMPTPAQQQSVLDRLADHTA